MPLPNVQAVREDKNPADHFDSGAKWTYCVNLTHQVYWWTYHVPCGPPMNLLSPPSYYLPRVSGGSRSLECPVAVPLSDFLWQCLPRTTTDNFSGSEFLTTGGTSSCRHHRRSQTVHSRYKGADGVYLVMQVDNNMSETGQEVTI